MARGRPSRHTVYARLDAALGELHGRLGGLPSPTQAESIWSDIWHLEAHHSTALEGNTLVLREVEALLGQGRAVGAKDLKEYMEVQGYATAAKWVYQQALAPDDWHNGQLISVNELRRIHHLAMTPVWGVAPHADASEAEGPGNYRQHDLFPFSAGMSPPSWVEVPARVTDWVAEAARLTDAGADPLSLPEHLARIHNHFEQIHPFIDGNGRTGRLALNLLLVRLGLPPVIIFKQQRSAYLSALQRADSGDNGPLGEMIARAMFDNLNRFIIPSVAGSLRLVPLASLVDQNLSIAALRQAAQRGRLEAFQGLDGIWRSSKAAVERYQKEKFIRRPRSQ
jgi:Fic family protein